MTANMTVETGEILVWPSGTDKRVSGTVLPIAAERAISSNRYRGVWSETLSGAREARYGQNPSLTIEFKDSARTRSR